MREFEVDARIMATTLLDPGFASPRVLDALYKLRWNIEVDFRTIKATLQMDVLRCKSQPMGKRRLRYVSWPTTWCAGRWRRRYRALMYCRVR
jgi:hypothetical protein